VLEIGHRRRISLSPISAGASRMKRKPNKELKVGDVKARPVDVKEEAKPVPEEKLEATNKPHYISIILSISALLISSLSFCESRKGRMINLSSNRALVYVTDLHSEESNAPMVASDYKIAVKNLGRSNAQAVRYWYKFVQGTYQPPNVENYGSESFDYLWAELPPGIQKEITIPILRGAPAPRETAPPANKEKLNDHTYLIGMLAYRDESSGEDYNQRWCYRLSYVMDMNQAVVPIQPCY
jgi:hypothetical protein